MEISNDEETFSYTLESYYLKDNYYKVVLVNQNNNYEQILLKNKDDIYVITPSLNKSFKFQSDWPNNSSQSYLIDIVVKDIERDKERVIDNIKDGYVIKSKVNYPNNPELVYQKVYLNNNLDIERVEVYNEDDIVKIKVVYSEILLNPKITEDEFKLENYIKEECNNEECKNESNDKKSASIDNIIYPLYVPSNTYLSSSEKVNVEEGNRVILTFSGEKNFVLIEEASKTNNNMEVIPIFGEPLMLSESIGALSSNSLSWDANNISYYLASTDLSIGEMQQIANSLGNYNLVSKEK